MAASICARIAASSRSPPRIWPAGVFSMSFTRADIAGHITRSNACRFFTMSASVVPVDSTVIDSGLSPALYAARKKSPTPAAPSPSGTARARAFNALRSAAVMWSSLPFTTPRPSTALMPACAQPPRCALTPMRLPRPSSAAMTVFGSPLLSNATLISNSSASLSSSAGFAVSALVMISGALIAFANSNTRRRVAASAPMLSTRYAMIDSAISRRR